MEPITSITKNNISFLIDKVYDDMFEFRREITLSSVEDKYELEVDNIIATTDSKYQEKAIDLLERVEFNSEWFKLNADILDKTDWMILSLDKRIFNLTPQVLRDYEFCWRTISCRLRIPAHIVKECNDLINHKYQDHFIKNNDRWRGEQKRAELALKANKEAQKEVDNYAKGKSQFTHNPEFNFLINKQ